MTQAYKINEITNGKYFTISRDRLKAALILIETEFIINLELNSET